MIKNVKSMVLGLAFLSCVGVYDANAGSNNTNYSEGFFFQPYAGVGYTRIGASLGNGLSDFFATDYNAVNPFVGARIHKNIGVELGYVSSASESKVNGAVTSDAEVSAFTFDVMGYYQMPQNEQVELIGLIGAGSYKSDYEIVAMAFDEDETDTGIRFGLGAQYLINEDARVRALVKYVHIDSNIIDNAMEYSLGVAYSF
ncbi:MAG: porin family protein [Alphaproteobacteria bacterium]|nr:porin family protein [Alphaproteobacteria bacterium]